MQPLPLELPLNAHSERCVSGRQRGRTSAVPSKSVRGRADCSSSVIPPQSVRQGSEVSGRGGGRWRFTGLEGSSCCSYDSEWFFVGFFLFITKTLKHCDAKSLVQHRTECGGHRLLPSLLASMRLTGSSEHCPSTAVRSGCPGHRSCTLVWSS